MYYHNNYSFNLNVIVHSRYVCTCDSLAEEPIYLSIPFSPVLISNTAVEAQISPFINLYAHVHVVLVPTGYNMVSVSFDGRRLRQYQLLVFHVLLLPLVSVCVPWDMAMTSCHIIYMCSSFSWPCKKPRLAVDFGNHLCVACVNYVLSIPQIRFVCTAFSLWICKIIANWCMQ